MSRPFRTIRDDLDAPDWAPLERVALLARRSPDLPSFHPGEFMYMARLSASRSLRIHLFKHCDTRRYLNLDDDGHAYAYCGSPPDDDVRSGGRYRLHRSLADAIHALGLEVFSATAGPRFFRSFPPEEWPPDPLSDNPQCCRTI